LVEVGTSGYDGGYTHMVPRWCYLQIREGAVSDYLMRSPQTNSIADIRATVERTMWWYNRAGKAFSKILDQAERGELERVGDDSH